ncbi:MAG: hypothetical protein KH354_07875 [Clostridiales bacterium]|nr:hypothetical protein [Clostridiales bacterium]
MKSIVPIIVIIILLISICVGMELYMNSSCEEMLRLCDETAESLSAESASYFAERRSYRLYRHGAPQAGSASAKDPTLLG